MFHDTFGYDAQGVVESTARLPDGWQDRLVRFETPATSGVTAGCLELHDLWISKAVAGRVLWSRVGLVRALGERIRYAILQRILS